MIDEKLQAEIDRVTAPYTEYYSTWEEIKEYYKDQNSERGWIGALAQDLTGSEARRGKEYDNMRRNIERWIDGSRKPGKASVEAMKALGQTLEPKRIGVPPGGLTIHFEGHLQVSEERSRYRSFNIRMDETTALDFAQSPNYEAIFEAFNVDGNTFAEGMEGDHKVAIH